MKAPFRKTAFLVLAFFLAQNASATNLVTDGTFTGLTYSDNAAKPIAGQLYGEFGSDGATLQVTGWTTAGYNYVFTAGTVSSGTQANGAAAGNTQETPGAGNGSNGYGNTFLWGKGSGGGTGNGTNGNNGGTTTITAPSTGNFVAADGIYQVGAITQTISGLQVGHVYVLTFEWGGAQQQGATFNKATTENWTASLTGTDGGQTFTTATVNDPAESFTGWQYQTFYFTATDTSEVLSFTAGGGPACEPPFALLANVDLELLPDVSNWMIFMGFGLACVGFQIVRRRRRRSELAVAAA